MESSVTVTIVAAGLTAGIGVFVGLTLWKRFLQWSHKTIRSWVTRRWPAFLPYVDIAFEVLDKATVYAANKTEQITNKIEQIVRSWRELRMRLLKQELQIERREDGQYTRFVVNWMYEPELSENKVIREVHEEQVSWDDLLLDLDKEARLKIIRQNKVTIDLTQARDREVMEYAQQI